LLNVKRSSRIKCKRLDRVVLIYGNGWTVNDVIRYHRGIRTTIVSDIATAGNSSGNCIDDGLVGRGEVAVKRGVWTVRGLEGGVGG